MSQSAVAAHAPLPLELVYDDGEPLESEWHTLQFPLLRELIRQTMVEHGRRDFFVGGNMFVYYSVEQARDVARGRPYFRGPDVFWVGGVESERLRNAWVAWEEGGHLPDVIVELLSPSTAAVDRNEKKEIYARSFGTKEYYLVDPGTRRLEGFGLAGRSYQPLASTGQGRFWSDQLGVFLGFWHGLVNGREADWVRLFRPDGSMVLTAEERAEAAEAEVARLRALLEGSKR